MKVFEFVPKGVENCKVTAWLHNNQRMHPAIIICPGGRYRSVSERGAEPVAKPYFAAGYHTFILDYAVNENGKGFYLLCQLASAVACVRKYAEEWFVEKEKIFDQMQWS
ncbi:MAG: hypothetical protein IJ036_03845 [Lachnospiraceae bacterium]|nr:hypothetical protein [Lachnospiraceae bacterium]